MTRESENRWEAVPELCGKPIIGLIPLADEEKDSYWMLPGYMNGIVRAGGIPIMLPLTHDEDILRRLSAVCEGFLFTGGHDIDPSLYGEQRLPQCGAVCRERDKMEQRLLSMAVAMNKPILGICRGIQMLNVFLGGTLYQDLPSQISSEAEHHQKPPYNIPVHGIKILRESPLHELLGTNTLRVNSYHHQAVKDLSARLKPMAVSEDGITEAVYMPDRKFVWGVQWHPEFMDAEDEPSSAIFAELVRKSSER